MTFSPEIVSARLAPNLIATNEMPRLAWDAREAGLDGPGISRLGSYENPTFFQVQEVLPKAMKEMNLQKLGKAEAGRILGRSRAVEILDSGCDPMKNLRAFEHLWIQSDYCRELQECGTLED